jgi:hypothetical protein
VGWVRYLSTSCSGSSRARGFHKESPNNKTKVLGILPDLGEELALKRLDGIASAIDAIYEHGAEIHITSDGLVYNGQSKPVLKDNSS